jgi:S1-C subfamily serine protease
MPYAFKKYFMYNRKKIILLLTVLLMAADGFSQSNVFIYQVFVKVRSGKTIMQTGFRLNGTQGIITCLHGVAGAVSITASNSSKQLKGLQVKQVDLNNDLALLQSQEIMNMNTQGLIKNNRVPFNGAALKVEGYPFGISSLNTKTVNAGNPFSNQLKGYIPPDSRSLFELRNSPEPGIEIYYIEGNLVPGHSGAPLLDPEEKVIGIVNGGIKGGAAGISWAIPVKNISWVMADDVSAAIKKLGNEESESLFATEEVNISDTGFVLNSDMKYYYRDADHDGHGDINNKRIAETAPPGYIEDGTDCCDDDPFLYDYKTAQTFFEDRDGDGHGTGSLTKMSNLKPRGFAELADDADDTDPYLYNRSSAKLYYPDEDGDGFGTAGKQKLSNVMPVGYVENNNDKDDTDARVHPGQTEFFTSISNGGTWDYNCDGNIQLQYPKIGHVATGPIELRACRVGYCCYYEGWVGRQVPPDPGQVDEYGVSCDPAVTQPGIGVPVRPMKINTVKRIQGAH